MQTGLALECAEWEQAKPAEVSLYYAGLNVVVGQEYVFKDFRLNLRPEGSYLIKS